MDDSLRYDVLRFVAEARRAPATAAGAPLEELEKAARRAFDGAYIAHTSPVAPVTWLARSTLTQAEDTTAPIQLPISEPIEIVGMHPSIVTLSTDPETGLLPPMEAIDVSIEIDRRETLTNTLIQGPTPGFERRIVPLVSISAEIANRLLGLVLDASDPVLAVSYSWAVPAGVREGQAWADVLISLALFVRPINRRVGSVY